MQIIDPVDEQIDITIDRVYPVDWLNRQYVQYVEWLDSMWMSDQFRMLPEFDSVHVG